MADLIPLSSVEVIATVAFDGKIRTRSMPMLDVSRTDSLMDEEDCLEETIEFEGEGESPSKLLSDRPGLVPLESNSDSDDSSSCDDYNVETSNGALIPKASTNSTDLALATAKSAIVAADDTSGFYDCISDHITRFFCPVDPSSTLQNQPASPKASATTLATNTCPQDSCTDYPFFSSGEDGSDAFSSLQFWWTPSQEEKRQTEKSRTKPSNRSAFTRRRRSKHIHTLWNKWHSETSIPIERSKSMLEAEELRCLKATPNHTESEVCYDSDPEQEYQQRRTRVKSLECPKRNSFTELRPAPVDTFDRVLDSQVSSFDEPVPQVPPTPRNSLTNGSGNFTFYRRRKDTFSSPKPRSRLFDSPRGPSDYDLMSPYGDHLLRSFIQEAYNSKIPLVWHRRNKLTDPCQTQTKVPTAVSAVFEVGAHLDNLVVQPKFTWSQKFEPELNQKKIQLSNSEPYSIELLSIIRVVQPTSLNRQLYPFARLDRTLCITTNAEEYPYLVFEAPSQRERDWLVNALKMIVARLASIIIVRDEAMLLEFFTPYSALMHMDQRHHEPEHPLHPPTLVCQVDGLETDDSNEFMEQREDGPTQDSDIELQLLHSKPSH